MEIFLTPEAWAALIALVTMEIVLGIDNLIFISIVTNKVEEARRQFAQRVGIGLALILRLVLLSGIAWIVGLTEPVFDLGISGATGPDGTPSFETSFSWRDLILIAGGIFLVWKATTEIHERVQPGHDSGVFSTGGTASMAFSTAIVQIIALDVVFSVDSILTAIGMTDHVIIMVIAVVSAVIVMLLAAGPLSRFVRENPTVVMLALAFLLMIGMVLIADGFGRHVPKGYIYAAMAFAALVEFLNMLSRRRPDTAAH